METIVPTRRLVKYNGEVATGELTAMSPQDIFRITQELSFDHGCFAPVLFNLGLDYGLLTFGVSPDVTVFDIEDIDNGTGISMGIEVISQDEIEDKLFYLTENQRRTMSGVMSSYSSPINILRCYVAQDNINRAQVTGESIAAYNARNQSKWLAYSHKYTALNKNMVSDYDTQISQILRGSIRNTPEYFINYLSKLLHLNDMPPILHEQLKELGTKHLKDIINTKLSISINGGKTAPFEAMKGILHLETQAYLFNLTADLSNSKENQGSWTVGKFNHFIKNLSTYLNIYGLNIGVSLDGGNDNMQIDPRIFYSTFLFAKSSLDKNVTNSEFYLNLSGLRKQNILIQYREMNIGEPIDSFQSFDNILDIFAFNPVALSTSDNLTEVILSF